MKNLKPDLDLDTFFRNVADSEKRLLLLDYDGTLAPFKVKRDKAFPYPGIRQALRAILDTEGSRLVLISGRSTKDLLPLLQLEPHPEIWGAHGWERLFSDNRHEFSTVEEPAACALEQVEANLEGEGLAHLCEKKHGCIAIHWRGMEGSEIKELRDRFLSAWSGFARTSVLSLIEFDGGIELRARGRNKAFVVQTLLSEMGQGTVSAFLGDDRTDEEAFNALEGKGLRVMVRSEFRPTAADLWLKPPEDVLDFLKRWRAASFDQDSTGRSAEPSIGTKGGVT
jgi:trehalose-phosphatase